MTSSSHQTVTLTLDKIVTGGQTLGTLEDGKKLFVWGGLPGETVTVQLTKQKSSYAEGVVVDILAASPERQIPRDPVSYLSTSPWQIISLDTENRYKEQLIREAFKLHHIDLPDTTKVYSDGRDYQYRNKMEFSFVSDGAAKHISLAFLSRGTHDKLPIDDMSLASEGIMTKAREVLAALNTLNVHESQLKSLLIRSTRDGETAWQLYVNDANFDAAALMNKFTPHENGEVIFSHPKNKLNVITKRLTSSTQPLSDTVLGVPFQYRVESFFQINLPVYEQALNDILPWIPSGTSTVDLYSGVGTIGLTIGGDNATLVEINKHAVREMEQNIARLGKKATPILAASESALEYITHDKIIIVDPPRAGLHQDVIDTLLKEKPTRIIYLSCNPVTQARDIARLAETYHIAAHCGYNFFPHTPHIEHLAILDLL